MGADPRLKKRHKLRAQEKKSAGILEEVFGIRGQFSFFGDTYENIDGCVELYDKDGYPLNLKPFFQLKSTTTDENSYDYEIEHLNYYHGEPHPTILFFVNIPKREVYYIVASKSYITKVLKIDPETHPHQHKNIKFLEQDLFKGDVEKFVTDYENEDFALTHVRQLEASSKGASKDEVTEHKRKVTQILAAESEKIYTLEALFFFYFPVHLTNIDLMKKIAEKAEVSNKEMEYLLEKMFDSHILINVKNLVSVRDPKVVKKFLEEIIARKGVEYLT